MHDTSSMKWQAAILCVRGKKNHDAQCAELGMKLSTGQHNIGGVILENAGQRHYQKPR